MGTKMSSAEFLVALKRWLGLPVSPGSHQCPHCNDNTSDVYSNHALQCGSGGCKNRRHNDLRDMLHHSAKAARLKPIREPPHLTTGEGRPADILTYEGDDQICNDIFVIHPFAATHVSATLADPGSATENYAEKSKHAPFAKLDIASTHRLRALGADTFGGWNGAAQALLSALAKNAAARHNSGINEATRHLTRRLNFCIIRHCARAILLRVPQSESHQRNNASRTPKTIKGHSDQACVPVATHKEAAQAARRTPLGQANQPRRTTLQYCTIATTERSAHPQTNQSHSSTPVGDNRVACSTLSGSLPSTLNDIRLSSPSPRPPDPARITDKLGRCELCHCQRSVPCSHSPTTTSLQVRPV